MYVQMASYYFMEQLYQDQQLLILNEKNIMLNFIKYIYS